MTIGVFGAVLSAFSAWAADPLDTWTISDTSNFKGGLRAITFAQGQFVAVGDGGTIATSLDGEKWTQRESGTPIVLRSVSYYSAQFIAVGGDGDWQARTNAILTSPDGAHWTARDPGTTEILRTVAYGNGRFVVLGGPDRYAPVLRWSEDAVNWNPGKGPSVVPGVDAPFLQGAAYGNGVFVAVSPGYDFGVPQSAAYVSSDGINWTRYDGVKGLGAVTFVNGQFVAVGGYLLTPLVRQSTIATSTDGMHWTQMAAPNNIMYAITYGAGQYVATGETATLSSPDAIHWTPHHVETVATGIAYGNGRFVLACGGILRSGPVGPKLQASLSPEGHFIGRLSGVDGQQIAIQASTNLALWSSFTNVAITNGVGQFTDSLATNSSKRFYRAVSQ